MKAITIIIAAVLSFSANVLFSANPGSPLEPMKNTNSISVLLSPVTPAEATFEDEVVLEVAPFDLNSLAPVTPEEADFNDNGISLSPVTPKEADFE